MKRLARHIHSFAADERGATAIEYCLIAGLISVAIVGGATQIGQSLVGMIAGITGGLQ
jgi:pilus assembly protein Flp/PilA